MNFECPLCSWGYSDSRPEIAAGALAGVFGEGVMASIDAHRRKKNAGRALRDHFRGHRLEEWVKTITELRGVLRAVLVFHEVAPSEERTLEWAKLTGRDIPTARALCDTVREVLLRRICTCKPIETNLPSMQGMYMIAEECPVHGEGARTKYGASGGPG